MAICHPLAAAGRLPPAERAISKAIQQGNGYIAADLIRVAQRQHGIDDSVWNADLRRTLLHKAFRHLDIENFEAVASALHGDHLSRWISGDALPAQSTARVLRASS